MEDNQKPLQNIDTAQSNDGDYTFVQERILTKRSRMFRFLSRVFWNLMIPVCVCVAVCYIFFTHFMGGDEPANEKETGTENGIIVNRETEEASEQTTTGNGDIVNQDKPANPDNLDIEENLVKLEETIKKMVVVVSVVREDTSAREENGVPQEGQSSTSSDERGEASSEGQSQIFSENQGETKDNSKGNIAIGQLAEKHTGVVVSMYGPVYVLIQYENIKDYKELYVHVGDSIMLDTTVYDIDYVTGLALLKIEKTKVTDEIRQELNVATFKGVSQVIEGTSIVYCGNVVGNAPMFMKGHISNSSNDVSCIDLNYNMLITDIMFEEARDGFLFNSKGNLIGIAGLGTEKLQLPSVVAGAGAMDLAYIINNMLNGKKDIYFGITGQVVSAKIEEIAGGSMPRGIYVSNVEIDSPAYNAGIMPGDIIYMIDRINEPDMDKFSRCIEGKSKGDTVSVGVKRRIGNEYNVYAMSVTLDNRD